MAAGPRGQVFSGRAGQPMRHRACDGASSACGVLRFSRGALPSSWGRLAPVGSPWELGLRRIAAEWDKHLRRVGHACGSTRAASRGMNPTWSARSASGRSMPRWITVSGPPGHLQGVKTLCYPLLVQERRRAVVRAGPDEALLRQELESAGSKPMMWSPGRLGVLLLAQAGGHSARPREPEAVGVVG